MQILQSEALNMQHSFGFVRVLVSDWNGLTSVAAAHYKTLPVSHMTTTEQERRLCQEPNQSHCYA